MRNYETDSPEARARILALAMVVDGHLDPAELKVLDETPVMLGLRIDGPLFRAVLDELCGDMLRTAVRGGSVEIDTPLLDRLLAEIADPELQSRMLAAMWKIVHADAQLAHAESVLLARAFQLWWPDHSVSAAQARLAA